MRFSGGGLTSCTPSGSHLASYDTVQAFKDPIRDAPRRSGTGPFKREMVLV